MPPSPLSEYVQALATLATGAPPVHDEFAGDGRKGLEREIEWRAYWAKAMFAELFPGIPIPASDAAHGGKTNGLRIPGPGEMRFATGRPRSGG